MSIHGIPQRSNSGMPNGDNQALVPIAPVTVADWLSRLVAPDDVAELRALHVAQRYGKPATVAGFFSGRNLEDMAVEALRLTDLARGVYLTMNPLKAEILARCANRTRIAETGDLASDQHVNRRRWLLVDVDPVRIAGISSTDTEKTAARDVADAVGNYLGGLDWPAPIWADSGNGWHLFYGLDLPADDRGLVQRCLAALAQRFDTEAAKVDTAVHNPARIVKVPGTMARKGDATPDRPHRRGGLTTIPATVLATPLELLEALAAEVTPTASVTVPAKPPTSAAPTERNGKSGHRHRLDVARWLSDRGIAFRLKDAKDARGRSVYTLESCPFNSDHKDAAVLQCDDGKNAFHCFHNSCTGRGWQECKDAIGKPEGDHYDPPLRVKDDREEVEGGSNVGDAHVGDPCNNGQQVPQPRTPAVGKVAAQIPPRIIPAYRPFPMEALPGPISEFVRQGAIALGCDTAFLALSALAVAASAIGNTRAIRLKTTWIEPSVLWTGVVADSGTLKSPAFTMIVKPLKRIQHRLRKEYFQACAEYQNKMVDHKAACAKAKEEGTEPPTEPEKPVFRRVVVDDVTIEKLAEILEDNPRGTLSARDELASWFNSHRQYKGKNGGSDTSKWLSMYNASDLTVDRKLGPKTHYYIPMAAVSVTGTIQEEILAANLTHEFVGAGGAARLLYAMPPKKQKKWSDKVIDPDVDLAYADMLEKLLALNMTERYGESAPHFVDLMPGAKDVWVEFYDAWAGEQAAVSGELAAAYSKLEGVAARLALIHHIVTQVTLGADTTAPIEPESVTAGIALCRWFAHEAQRVYAMLAESPDDRKARHLVNWIGCIWIAGAVSL